MNLSPFELAGLLTHLAVFVVGLGGSVGILPLARGRRSGLGLILMALSMTVLVLQPVLQPHWLPDGWTAIGLRGGFRDCPLAADRSGKPEERGSRR